MTYLSFPPTRLVHAALTLAMAACGTILALQAQKPARDIPLRVNYGMDTTIHRVTNDAADDYVDQSQNVFAILYPAGNQGLNTQADTRQPAVRSLCFGSGDAVTVEGETGPPFPAAGCANAVVVMTGYDASSKVIQSMTLGESTMKLLRFNWTVGSYRYRLGYGTDMNSNDEPDAPPAIVTCTVVAAGRCTAWTLTPQGPGALYRSELISGRNGRVTEGPNTYVGHYDMPFVETLWLK